MRSEQGRYPVVALLVLCAATALANEATESTTGAGQVVASPAVPAPGQPQQVLAVQQVTADMAAYQSRISALETRHGPYAEDLSQLLLGLATIHHRQGLHERAIPLFKRSVHVARVNHGLHSASQIPLLQGLIGSLVSSGDYAQADRRQRHLFRLQGRNYGADSPQLARAMLEQAAWRGKMYQLDESDAPFEQLSDMSDLYRDVYHNIRRTEGDGSTRLLEPLQGLLQTHYLISAYSDDAGTAGVIGYVGASRFVEQHRSAEKHHFAMISLSNYRKGRAALAALRKVHDYNGGEQNPRRAEAMIWLGDWHLWHQKRELALRNYQQAWDELARLEDGAEQLARYFGQPRRLPNLPNVPDRPEPAVIQGHAAVSYYIDARGRVRDLTLLNTKPVNEQSTREPGKLLRRIKSKRYRPMFAAREPVATDTIHESYAY